ncbi:MAG: hypothetical protein ACLFU4_07425 [Opitutales bacterium]
MKDAGKIQAIEIKSGETIHPNWLEGLKWFHALAPDQVANTTIIYGGTRSTRRSGITITPWTDIGSAF